MIRVESLNSEYQSRVRNESHEILSDAPVAKGGSGAGFGAHELLEASLAACLNMAVRMYAKQQRIPMDNVTTTVKLSWPDSQTTRFEYQLDIRGDITTAQRSELEAVADRCPVRQTLSKTLAFARIT